jgi:hypothetical protein
MELINDKQFGLNFVFLLTGIVFIVFASLCFIIIYNSYIDSLNVNYLKNIEAIFALVSVPVLAYIVGFFIHGLKYSLGTSYYIHIYNKAQKKKKKSKTYPGVWQRIIFWVVRDGTVIEECLNNVKEQYTKIEEKSKEKISKLDNLILKKKDGRVFYDWIQKSKKKDKNPLDDMWIYAKQINHKRPEDNIYQFFNMSQTFQCFDMAFLLCSMLLVLLVPLNFVLKFICNYQFSIFSIVVLPLVFSLFSFVLFATCRSSSKSMANRFLYHIDISLKAILSADDLFTRKENIDAGVKVPVTEINE